MQRRDVLGLAFVVVVLAAPGCKPPQRDGPSGAPATATIHAAELTPPAPPPRPTPHSGLIEQIAVQSDRPVLLVRGRSSRPILHLHGMCGEARSDLEAWAGGVSEHGTIIALAGDADCKGSAGDSQTWTADVAAIDRRIDAAIEAVRGAGVGGIDAGEILLVGESMGASRATSLAKRFPTKYTRLVLVGAPEVPSPNDLHRAKAVALVVGEKEAQEKMRAGLTRLANAGISARLWELPDATHGTYGSEGSARMRDAVAYVLTH